MIARILLWTARITGSLLLAFLLFMLVGHLAGDANPEGMRFNSAREILAFAFFPCCTIIGLALAYKWELLGGAIAVGSMVALFLLRSDLLQGRFLAMVIPGLLYLVLGMMAGRPRSGA